MHRNGFRQFLNVTLKLAHVKSGREEVVELKQKMLIFFMCLRELWSIYTSTIGLQWIVQIIREILVFVQSTNKMCNVRFMKQYFFLHEGDALENIDNLANIERYNIGWESLLIDDHYPYFGVFSFCLPPPQVFFSVWNLHGCIMLLYIKSFVFLFFCLYKINTY